jgi:prepilin-type N-terminal cleavage/methylation domain-containing protein
MRKFSLSIPSSHSFSVALEQRRPFPAACAHSFRHSQSGFTLIETLATLTIFAIVMALLSTSLFQVARLAELSEQQTTQSRDDVIRLAWFKSTINAGVTDWAGGKHLFQGNARQVSGLTTRPLGTQYTGRTAFEWRLVYNATNGMTELRYRETAITAPAWQDRPAAIDIVTHTWAGNRGRFTFLQETGDFNETWLPILDPKLGTPALPVGVMLEFGDTAQVAFITIADRSPPILRAKDI